MRSAGLPSKFANALIFAFAIWLIYEAIAEAVYLHTDGEEAAGIVESASTIASFPRTHAGGWNWTLTVRLDEIELELDSLEHYQPGSTVTVVYVPSTPEYAVLGGKASSVWGYLPRMRDYLGIGWLVIAAAIVAVGLYQVSGAAMRNNKSSKPDAQTARASS